jgi:hypothetical protein
MMVDMSVVNERLEKGPQEGPGPGLVVRLGSNGPAQ